MTRYIQTWFRGRLIDAIHVVKGPYAASAAVKASDEAGLVEAWCGQIYQDRVGLLPGQDTEMWIQGVSSDHANPMPPGRRKGVWCRGTYVCSMCLKTLQIHTEYPGQLVVMDNDALYQEFRDAHHPDDYDSDFTTAGRLRLLLVVAETERRLRVCGFLSKGETDAK